jgi:hypothetical protein
VQPTIRASFNLESGCQTMKIPHMLKQTAAGLFIMASAIGSAQAGLVTGSADPVFGPALPGVSYRLDYSVYLPDAYLVAAQAVPNPTFDLTPYNVHLTGQVSLYETANRSNFASENFDFRLGAVTYDFSNSGVVVGWDLFTSGERLSLPALTGFALAGGNSFDLTWASLNTAPDLRCTTCIGFPPSASLANLIVNYVDRTDGGSSKLGQDGDGNDLGVEYQYDAQGVKGSTNFRAVYRAVPEPGVIALLLIALAGAALARRGRSTH